MSNNPYKVLGISPDADDETVKKAYRDLARKYHPDRYTDSDLADIASEKMKEVNAAYEEILRMRAGGERTKSGGTQQNRDRTDRSRQSGNGQYTSTDYSRYSEDTRVKFTRARNAINEGNVDEAEALLAEVNSADRGAEWFFLTGCVQLRRGFYVDAQQSFDIAYRMEPNNNEYWTFKEKMHERAGRYGGGYQTNGGGSACTGCDICSGLICADCCCECMGGDLIPCC